MSDPLTRDEFIARFKARMMAKAVDLDGTLAEYADQAAQSYWDETDMRDEGPEECADSDMSYWEP